MAYNSKSTFIGLGILFFAIFLIVLGIIQLNKRDLSIETERPDDEYALHENITPTVFWIGEEASQENLNISNYPSAWDSEWKKSYGGYDSPRKRNNYHPAEFTPNENPFYIALPYNDFEANGKRKDDAYSVVPWSSEKEWQENESMLKNRWIKIVANNKEAYGQWEDVGPFEENDSAYVFGQNQPKSKVNQSAGIDVSPAVRDYLQLEDIDTVNWQFVKEDDVPEGPWKEIITYSNINWK